MFLALLPSQSNQRPLAKPSVLISRIVVTCFLCESCIGINTTYNVANGSSLSFPRRLILTHLFNCQMYSQFARCASRACEGRGAATQFPNAKHDRQDHPQRRQLSI